MSETTSHDAFNGRNVLIIGGLGFLGSNLALRLVEAGNVRVVILDAMVRGQGGNPFNVQPIRESVDVRYGDMGDQDTITQLLSGIDYVFNLAGSSGHLDSIRDPKNDLALNCEAQLTLLEACRNFNPHAKIVFTSTRQVYGNALYLPVDENHRVAPLDINGIHKFAAENYHVLYHRIYGIRTVCLRLTNTFGPRLHLDHDRQGFLPWFIRQAMDGETIQLFGGGRQTRDLNFVDDVVDALLLAAASENADGQVYNLGAPEPWTLEHIARELIAITGKGAVEASIFPSERQDIEIGNIYTSYEKIRNALGWQPKTDLRIGLERTVKYYQEYRDHYRNTKNSLSRSLKAA
ncbi:MAG: NAD-dependent epimerase/dehydratase family protein [Acidobacteria bacterium]|nr:NAD-dependent epimerase/dehydratase family protein [Acidobacteriota bacterium]